MSSATQTLNFAIASPGNRLSRLLWMVSCSLLVSASHGRAHQPDPVISPYVQRPPVIDGKLSEWPASDFITVTPQTGVFDAESDSTADPGDLSFAFSVSNDDRYLYFAIRTTDDILVVDDNRDPSEKAGRPYMDDAIEIFIDGDHSHSPDGRDEEGIEYRTGGEFAVVANGAVSSSYSGFPRTNGDSLVWSSAGSYPPSPAAAYQAPWDTTGGEFGIEVRINLAVMGAGVGPGSRVGFTVSAHDDDDGGERDAALYWKGLSPSCWKNESGWGDVLLSKRPK